MDERFIKIARGRGLFTEHTASSLIVVGTGAAVDWSALVNLPERKVVGELIGVQIAFQFNSAVGGTGPIELIRASTLPTSAVASALTRQAASRFGRESRNSITVSGSNATDAGAQTTIPIGAVTATHWRFNSPNLLTAVGVVPPIFAQFGTMAQWEKPGVLIIPPGEMLSMRHTITNLTNQFIANWAWREWSSKAFSEYFGGNGA